MVASAHFAHDHVHSFDCGHLAIVHDGHVDYVHDGHLHHPSAAGVLEHELGTRDVIACEPHTCAGHDDAHFHGVGCEHVAVPHDGHIDYVVEGHIHRLHGEHCDDHGMLIVARPERRDRDF